MSPTWLLSHCFWDGLFFCFVCMRCEQHDLDNTHAFIYDFTGKHFWLFVALLVWLSLFVFFLGRVWFGAFDCFYLLRTLFVLCPCFNNKYTLFLQASEIMYAVKLKCLRKIAKCMSSLTVKLWSCLGSQANNCRQTASLLLVVNLKFNKKGFAYRWLFQTFELV